MPESRPAHQERLSTAAKPPAQNDSLAAPGNAVTQEAVAGREEIMFVVGAVEAVPSGLPPLASEPNKALVKFAVKQ